ncbi:MAG: OsmC family protein [Rhodospirillaceae bacterium]|nr:OsmC family protein [Rhodospirillaceae bacterium]
MSAENTTLPQGTVEVSETLSGRYTNQVRVGRHTLLADEPVNVGGDDAGPSPHDWVMAGLGACTSMTLRMYAERKGLALKKVSVRVWMRKIKAADCADCVTKDGEVTEMMRDISLEGDLTDEQKTRLIEIANKCPVHKTLSGEIKIRTHLVN